jgi:putative transposase
MDQRLQFVSDALSDRFTMTELCERYGVSRRIGYKWLARFNEDGKRGLVNRSRRPHTCPTQIRPVLAELLCEFRRLHPDWGARKLLKVLRRRHPEIEDWPAASTAADLRPAGPGAAAAPAARASPPGRDPDRDRRT